MSGGRFQGQVGVVTGGAGGFGSAVGRRLLADGAKVVLVDREEEQLAKLAAELAAVAGDAGRVVAVTADVSREADVAAYVRRAVDEFGRIDLFFNNAGIEGKVAPLVEQEAENFDRVMAVNCRGVFLGLRDVMRVMYAEGGGAIVNTASMAGVIGGPEFSPYIASKHAVVGLTKTAALESASRGVRVNAICPGHIDTRMARALTAQRDPDDPESVMRATAERVPMGRYGTAEEVANLATWLLSAEASYVTGAIYLIDAGITAA